MKKTTFTDEIREAIRKSGVSQYAIWNACGIDKGNMSRFMKGEGGLSLEAIDRIAAMIGLRVTLDEGTVNRGKRSE